MILWDYNLDHFLVSQEEKFSQFQKEFHKQF